MNIFCTFSGCIADKPQPLFFYEQFWGKSVDYLPVFNVFQVQNNQGRSILILRLCRDTIIALYSSRFPWILKQHLKQLLERLNPICTRNGGHDQNFRKQQRLEFLINQLTISQGQKAMHSSLHQQWVSEVYLTREHTTIQRCLVLHLQLRNQVPSFKNQVQVSNDETNGWEG